MTTINIQEAGACGDGVTVNTGIIQECIDKIGAAGGAAPCSSRPASSSPAC